MTALENLAGTQSELLVRRSILDHQESDPALTLIAQQAIVRELVAIDRELARRVRLMDHLGTLHPAHARQ
jgi:hypothetical protein